ncbi:MAG: tRNA-(ms[2]io[6]A)-hydroxylase [Myxococcales bacterium]|nr:tRNA-(ms[2]io[6]A)-hydroxylase [Myxococcales bacterium]MDD9970784.1 tRNA-(ms[2]io[6]A)-hydroxylase [Myxococcales bacterium]
MLGLLHPTSPAWIDAVEADLETMLQDHAQCELKAAHSALSLVGRYGGDHPAMVEPLVALAQEETEHVGQVTKRLTDRGQSLGAPTTDTYVRRLARAARAEHHDGYPPLLDRLLVAALVEGRSCERFRLLSDGLSDAALRSFYRELMGSEARHFALFSRLASDAFGVEDTRARLATLATREGEIASSLPLSPQVHG